MSLQGGLENGFGLGQLRIGNREMSGKQIYQKTALDDAFSRAEKPERQ